MPAKCARFCARYGQVLNPAECEGTYDLFLWTISQDCFRIRHQEQSLRLLFIWLSCYEWRSYTILYADVRKGKRKRKKKERKKDALLGIESIHAAHTRPDIKE